jgi:hypothetical protein
MTEKPKRGRPRKKPIIDSSVPKNPVGRPRKVPKLTVQEAKEQFEYQLEKNATNKPSSSFSNQELGLIVSTFLIATAVVATIIHQFSLFH